MPVYNTRSMPRPLKSYYRRRRVKRGLAAGALGTGLLFGTRRGRRVIDAGMRFMPKGMRRAVAPRLQKAFRAQRALKAKSAQVARRATTGFAFSSWGRRLARSGSRWGRAYRAVMPRLARLLL